MYPPPNPLGSAQEDVVTPEMTDDEKRYLADWEQYILSDLWYYDPQILNYHDSCNQNDEQYSTHSNLGHEVASASAPMSSSSTSSSSSATTASSPLSPFSVPSWHTPDTDSPVSSTRSSPPVAPSMFAPFIDAEAQGYDYYPDPEMSYDYRVAFPVAEGPRELDPPMGSLFGVSKEVQTQWVANLMGDKVKTPWVANLMDVMEDENWESEDSDSEPDAIETAAASSSKPRSHPTEPTSPSCAPVLEKSSAVLLSSPASAVASKSASKSQHDRKAKAAKKAIKKPQPVKKYRCPNPVCTKSFKNKNGLKFHLEFALVKCNFVPEATSDITPSLEPISSASASVPIPTPELTHPLTPTPTPTPAPPPTPPLVPATIAALAYTSHPTTMPLPCPPYVYFQTYIPSLAFGDMAPVPTAFSYPSSALASTSASYPTVPAAATPLSAFPSTSSPPSASSPSSLSYYSDIHNSTIANYSSWSSPFESAASAGATASASSMLFPSSAPAISYQPPYNVYAQETTHFQVPEIPSTTTPTSTSSIGPHEQEPCVRSRRSRQHRSAAPVQATALEHSGMAGHAEYSTGPEPDAIADALLEPYQQLQGPVRRKRQKRASPHALSQRSHPPAGSIQAAAPSPKATVTFQEDRMSPSELNEVYARAVAGARAELERLERAAEERKKGQK